MKLLYGFAAAFLLLTACDKPDAGGPPAGPDPESAPSPVLRPRPGSENKLRQSSLEWKAVQHVLECAKPNDGKARAQLDQISAEAEDAGDNARVMPTDLLVFGFQPAAVSTSQGLRRTRFAQPAADVVDAVRHRYGVDIPVTGDPEAPGGATLQIKPGQLIRVAIDPNTHQTALTCEP